MQALCATNDQLLNKTQFYIEQQYARCYNAKITCDYDDLIVVRDRNKQPLAAAGFRAAGMAEKQQSLYLESYLDQPLECLLSEQYQTEIKREELVEIGNFVATNNRAAFILMQHLWSWLQSHGYIYALLTCTELLERRLRGLPVTVLSTAQASRVSNPQQWGSYYQQNPKVMVGKLSHYDHRFHRIRHNPNWNVSYACKSGEFDA